MEQHRTQGTDASGLVRRSSCAFIEGDGPFAGRDPFCGKPTVRDLPYCAEHAARCYRKFVAAEAEPQVA
jgi:hypothetical protein